MSGSVTMRNLMGVDTAMELAMSGRELDAVEAKSLGMVSRVCADPLVEARVCPHPYHQVAGCTGGDRTALQPGLGPQR